MNDTGIGGVKEAIVLIKGKGAYFAEGKVESHNMPITEDMWKACVEGGDRHVG